MPTTRSSAPVNRSGLQRGSQPSKRKRSNADEHARKRLKDEIDSDGEEGEQKTKGGRDGKRAKGMKKKKHLRCELDLLSSVMCTNHLHRKTSLDKAREDAVAKEAAKAYK